MKLFPYALILLPFCLAAQSDPPAAEPNPPAAQPVAPAESLHVQAQKFYDALVKGKPRLAQALVCEAGQDEFYNHQKPMFLTAVVASVDLSPDAKSAKVTTTVQLDMMMRLPNGPGKMPVVSNWTLENESWCYVPEAGGSDEVVTAFGKLRLHPGSGPAGAGNPAANRVDLTNAAASAARASTVRFSKQSLGLPSGVDGADSLVITNGSLEEVTLEYGCPKASGLRCELDHSTLGKGGTATLTVKYSPAQGRLEPDASIKVTVKPFGREVLVPIVLR